MNLINLLSILGTLGVVLVFSVILARLFGSDPWAVGLFLGILVFIGWVISKIYLIKNALPKCENGCCVSKDYEVLGLGKNMGVAERGMVLKCRCGRRYLHMGNKLFSISETGQIKKYKIDQGLFFHRWVPDSTG